MKTTQKTQEMNVPGYEALADVLAVYPEASVEWNERGVVLRPSAPPVPTDLHPVRGLPSP